VQELKSFNINFGPQHPASHGVLRLILQLRGEIIEKSDTHIGLLHRGTEKLIESKNYLLSLPYFDRLDYISVLAQEHAYCLAIEKLMSSTSYQSDYVQIRVIFDELTRILNHLMAVSTHSLDVGCMAPVFWAFEEREKIMEFYERVSGARMHAAFYRPNDLNINHISYELLTDIVIFSKNLIKRLMMIENKLAMTSIWKFRLVNVGILDYKFISRWGFSGVLARSIGFKRDLRLSFNDTYSNYYYLKVRSFLGKNGDCYDRYLIRMREMVESLSIISQVINNLNHSHNIESKICKSSYGSLNYNRNYNNDSALSCDSRLLDHNYNNIDSMKDVSDSYYSYLEYISSSKLSSYKRYKQSTWYISMEDLIRHFKYYNSGLVVKKGLVYSSIEAPKGEFGVSLISDGSNKPYRCKIRGSSYYHLQALDTMIQGHFFSDLITIIGSLDLVMGEVDR